MNKFQQMKRVISKAGFKESWNRFYISLLLNGTDIADLIAAIIILVIVIAVVALLAWSIATHRWWLTAVCAAVIWLVGKK